MWSRQLTKGKLLGFHNLQEHMELRHVLARRLVNKKFRIIDDKIELLRIMGAISNEEYFQYMKFKKIRNRIIHKGKGAIEKETKELLDFSRRLTKDFLNINR